MIVGEDVALEIPTDVTKILVYELSISMETTGGNASWINRDKERYKVSIQNMVRAGLLESNQEETKWCCATET